MKRDANGIFVPAGLLIGMGVGFLIDQVVGGLFIGLGSGLLVMAIMESISKNKSNS